MNRHSMMWRAPGRRDEEREKFAALMAKVETIRLRDRLTKGAVAEEIGTTPQVLRSWCRGDAIGRKESVAKIEKFIKKRRETASRSRTAPSKSR